MKRRKFLTDTANYAALTLLASSMLNNNLYASNSPLTNPNLLTSTNPNSMHLASNYQNVTTVVKLKGKDIKVHALCTGTVAVKTNFRTKKGWVN